MMILKAQEKVRLHQQNVYMLELLMTLETASRTSLPVSRHPSRFLLRIRLF
jgi:hypothetical protein